MSLQIFLFYSHFSSMCKSILDRKNIIKDITFICIDNPSIRTQILNHSKYNIKVVPSILIFDDDTLTRLEGKYATQFIINNYNYPEPTIVSFHNLEKEVSNNESKNEVTNINNFEKEEQQVTDINDFENKEQQVTDINDLVFESEKEEQRVTDINDLVFESESENKEQETSIVDKINDIKKGRSEIIIK